MEMIGTVARLQIQRSSLKLGAAPHRWYDPSPLLSVPTLQLDADGVTGFPVDAGAVLDVHHRLHPATRNHNGVNGISVGFTGHYAAMQARFGQHVTAGVAGENILIETSRIVTPAELAHGLLIETADGTLAPLHNLLVAEPCVEFTRYALGHADRPPIAPVDRAVTEALDWLRGGMRGFYATYVGSSPCQIHIGARVYRDEGRELLHSPTD